jgi:hypothetical protein
MTVFRGAEAGSSCLSGNVRLPRPGAEALGPAGIGLAVFREQGIEEALPCGGVLDDADGAEHDDAAIGDRAVAFEAAVVEHLARLVDLEAHALVVIDIRPQMAAPAGIVHQHFAVRIDIEQRHAIGRAVGADGREAAAKAARERLDGARLRHRLVGASQLA